MRIRPNTWDANIVEAVLVRNEYALPTRMDGQIVVDIGAHIGAFAVACMKRNAERVVCFEPDPENFELLNYNVTDAENEGSETDVVVFDTAVTGLSSSNLGIRRLTDHDFDNGRNTGHVDVFGNGTITGISIIDVLGKIVPDNIDILKIDCEGMEWDIFERGDFSRVKTICGELHAVPDVDHPFLERFKGKTFQELAAGLEAKLRKDGFDVTIVFTAPFLANLFATKNRTVRVAESKKPKVLWIGDAGMNTGYARVTDKVCRGLLDKGWDVRVLGIGFNGDPHNAPYKIYPAVDPNTGGVRNGSSRIKDVIGRWSPNVAVIQDDSWNVGAMVDSMAMYNCLIPTVGYLAIDSENVRQDVATQLRNIKHAICHTQFGVDEIRKAGFTGPTSIAAHGVDTNVYFPVDRTEAREGMPLPHGRVKDAFIWGAVGMNQPRKALDLLIAYWAAWWKSEGKPDNAYLYLHTNADGVWDLRQLATANGIRGRLFGTEGGQTLREAELATLYGSFDVVLSTSEGESFGIPLLESMACGSPNIAVECGGAPSWAGDAIHWVKPSFYRYTSNRTNTKRWIASEADYVKAMHDMYTDTALRDEYSRRGLELAHKMKWGVISDHFHQILSQVVNTRKIAEKATNNVLEEF